MELPGAPPSMIITISRKSWTALPLRQMLAWIGDASTRSTIAEILTLRADGRAARGRSHPRIFWQPQPLERGIDAYRNTSAGSPLHFVTLVPLSQYSANSWRCSSPLLGAAVVFEPSSNPAEIIRTISKNAPPRSSPFRMLDLLHAGSSGNSKARQSQWLNGTLKNAKGKKFSSAPGCFAVSPPLWLEIWAFISGGAALRMKRGLFQARVMPLFRLWHDGDSIFDQPESPVSRDGSSVARFSRP